MSTSAARSIRSNPINGPAVTISEQWPPVLWRFGLSLAAIAIGLALTNLPVELAAIAAASVAVTIGAIISPTVALSVMLLFATFKPLTDYFVPELPLDIGQLALLGLAGSWLLQSLIKRQIVLPHSPLTLPVLAFIGAAGLSIPGALSAGYALRELIKWLEIPIIMWLVISIAKGKNWRIVFGMILAAGVIQALIGVWQFALRGEGPEHFLILNDRFYRAYGTFEQPNPYGGFMALGLSLSSGITLTALSLWIQSLRKKLTEREETPGKLLALFVLLGGVSILLLAGLIMSWSRGAWLGFGAAMIAMALVYPRRSWAAAGLLGSAILIGLILVNAQIVPGSIMSRLTDFASELSITSSFDARGVDITPENYAVVERLAHWQAAQEMARYHFWVGIGLGNYETVYPAYELMNWPYPLGHAHNIYLNMLAETGIIGLTAYIAMWVVILWHTWGVVRRGHGWERGAGIGLLGAWVGLSAHMLVDNLYVANIPLHIGAMLGILSILIASRDRDNKELSNL